ncbi:uncharacterized protein YfbL-like isoform X2 [Ptychodera flava]|uniref:uncharacterized protein YfbL-like isoform X2 n=1 Tax=Ptychodera flava TaxID=63121 RepID=UPI00396A8A77
MSVIGPLIFVCVVLVDDVYVQCQTQFTVSSGETELPVFNETAENLRKNLVDYFSTERHHRSPGAKEKARDFIFNSFVSYGMRVENQTFATENIKYPGDNIIGILDGEYAGTRNDKITLVGANYDTIRDTDGVDDNGSGVVAMLEVAKELTKKGCKRKYTTIFVAFDMDEQEDEDSISACFSRITCGSSSFVSDWLSPYLLRSGDQKVINGAIILESIMNFDDDENSQDISNYRGFDNIDEIEANENRGDFLAVIGRKLDADLASRIEENWEDLPEDKYKIQNFELNIEGVPSTIDQILHMYFMQSDHFNFWNEEGMKAVYLTDTRDARGIMKECYHSPCDDLDRVTDDKLLFLAKTVHALRDSLHDMSETDFNSCKPELIPVSAKDLDLVVKKGELGTEAGSGVPCIGMVTMVSTLAIMVLFAH